MDLTVRPITDSEVAVFRRQISRGFGGDVQEEDDTRFRAVFDLDRTVAAFDGRDLIGTCAAFTFTVTVPGGKFGAKAVFSGPAGAGIGGLITLNTFSKGGGIRFSIVGTPWTRGAAVITGVPNRITLTQNGVITSRFTITETRTVSGFAHGPASASSSTAKLGGVIQFVTPTELLSNLEPPTPIFTILKLHVIPEPSLILLLGSGVAGLVLLGRSRIRP